MNTELMRQPLELIVGDKRFTVQPFTIDQVIQMERLSLNLTETKLSPLEQARELLRIALSEDHGDTDVSKLRLEPAPLLALVPKLIEFAGFRVQTPGEAPAAA